MTNYTNNYVVNPSFQQGLTGYSALLDSTIQLDTSNTHISAQSLLVSCPGTIPGEGVQLPQGTIPLAATCSVSCYVYGSGNITAAAIDNTGATLATTPVMLSASWQRIVISGLSIGTGASVGLTLFTTDTNPAVFWVSSVQVEDSSPAHAYCDGDQPGCSWTGNIWGNTSFQLYQNTITAVSNIVTSSSVYVLNIGQISQAIPNICAIHDYSPLVYPGAVGPVGSVTDFSISLLTDPDPAQTFASWNTGGATAPTSGYNRSFGVFIPPKDYIVSDGSLLYKRAAYASMGWLFSSVTNTSTVTLDRIQAEALPITTGYAVPSPSAWTTPRRVNTILVANRTNYCPNPGIEVSTASWSALGTATLARDTSVHHDGVASLNITVNANSDGAQITIPNLLTGFKYTASAYVQAGPGLANIDMFIAAGSTSVLASAGTGYGFNGYGAGPYGGFNPTVDLATSTWFRLDITFTATLAPNVLQITAVSAGDVSYPTHLWVDSVLVEPGENLNSYFDGSFGAGYSWDVGGSAGLTRSYYYKNQPVGKQAVLDTLTRNLPLGISYAAPLYSTPPIQ